MAFTATALTRSLCHSLLCTGLMHIFSRVVLAFRDIVNRLLLVLVLVLVLLRSCDLLFFLLLLLLLLLCVAAALGLGLANVDALLHGVLSEGRSTITNTYIHIIIQLRTRDTHVPGVLRYVSSRKFAYPLFKNLLVVGSGRRFGVFELGVAGLRDFSRSARSEAAHFSSLFFFFFFSLSCLLSSGTISSQWACLFVLSVCHIVVLYALPQT